MASTYEPIATTTLGSAAAQITFSSIPSTYTDLRMVFKGIESSGSRLEFRFNSDTGTNYSQTSIAGNGSAASSARTTSQSEIKFPVDFSSTIPTLLTFDVFSYSGSTYKTCLATWSGDYNGSGQTQSLVGLWRSTSAINFVQFAASGSTFAAGTTITIYGIKAA